MILSEVQAGDSIVSDEVILSQHEAMSMIAAQVMNNNVAVTAGISTGHFKLNVLKPLIIKNVVHSVRILSDICNSFTNYFINHIKLITYASKTPMDEYGIV